MTREEAITILTETQVVYFAPNGKEKVQEALNMAIEALSAEAVQSEWRTGKPIKSGTYLVTVDSMRHGMVDIFHFGKPLLPNIAVKGMCWYRSDDEWGDVVYDDADILAWQPLPTPYKGD